MAAFTLASSGNLITPAGRMSYPYLLTPNPKAKTKDGKLKYTVSLLLPPDTDLSVAKKAAQDAAVEKFGAKVNDEHFRKSLRLPFLDAFEKTKGDEQFKGWVMLRLASVNKPQIIDASNAEVIEPHEVYAGRWARFTVRAFAYDTDGNRGVSFGLQNAQLLDHGEPLAANFARATDEFDPVVAGAAASGGGSKGGAGLFD